jgi:hypothetical protein
VTIRRQSIKSLTSRFPKSFKAAMTKQQVALCEKIKRLGYAQNNQVKLYGEIFDLVSDPVSVGENLVFVDGLERKSGHLRRVRIPLPVVHMAMKQRHAA